MEKFVLKHRGKIISFLTFGLMVALVSMPFSPYLFAEDLEEEDDVTVTATIQAWLNFAIDETDLTLDQDLVDSDGGTHIGTANTELTVGTNNALGWNLQIEGSNNGLAQVEGEHVISTVSGRDTLVAGTDGYGATIDDLGALGEGNNLNIETNWVEEADFAGEVTDSATQIVSYDGVHENTAVANFIVRAAAEAVTPSGDYTDTITITATAPID